MSLYKRLHEVQSGDDSDTRTEAPVAQPPVADEGDPSAGGSGRGGGLAAAAAVGWPRPRRRPPRRVVA